MLDIFSFPDCCDIFAAMNPGHFILHENEYNEIQSVLRKLLADSYAKVVFLVDKNGSLMASAGETANFDTTSLASLAAGNIAATGGLASLIGEKEFSILFHEGERDNMHISVVDNRLILVVIFDRRSSVGLVRLRVRRADEDLGRILKSIDEAARREEEGEGVIEELTEADIESLFK
jgi:predicted regulator of Ras-like GTPase activity (Roadblock/LC7/MglB family)